GRMRFLVPARRARVYGASRHSFITNRISIWKLRVAQPGLARRVVESSSNRIFIWKLRVAQVGSARRASTEIQVE
ncbi:hypothetical protein A2U01_0037395, partial [Trifolium medium]|nr:hypothetical protein [Trifolium medium]